VVRSDAIEGAADFARLGVGAAFVLRYLVEQSRPPTAGEAKLLVGR